MFRTHAVTVSTARTTLPALLDAVEEGEEITITRHGRVVAVIVRPDALRSKNAQEALVEAEKVHSLLLNARMSALPPRGLSARRADALMAELRSEREAS